MQTSSTNAQGQPRRARWDLRRTVLYLLSISPVLLLITLLAWGQFRTNPGGLVEHNEFGEVVVQQRTAPAFQGTDLLSGQPVSNDDLRGRVVMVDFWSSWCVACRVEAAALASVYHEYSDRVEFVGISIWDTSRDALAHIQRYDVTYPNLLDPQGASAVGYGVRGIPEKFFLDEEGQIVRKLIGPLSEDRLRQVLDEMLAG